MSKNKSLAIIEINDSGHCCGTNIDEIFISPGYAFLSNDRIETGDIALKKSFLSPQNSFNQFWRQLNLSPLNHPTKKARHNADLAFQQLTDLHKKLNNPSQIIFAVPGSLDREQLSIILGLAEASSFEILGLIDSAIAATCNFDIEGRSKNDECLIYMDIELHQTVFTRLLKSKTLTKRLSVDVVSDIGIKTIYDVWARNIANKFIKEHRYDPLYTAEGEWQLYNSLPKWLEKLNRGSETMAVLSSPLGNYQLTISLDELLTESAKKINQLKKKFMTIIKDDDILVANHRLKLLPGVIEKLGEFHILKKDAAIFGAFENIQNIKQGQKLRKLVTSLNIPSVDASQNSNSSSNEIPTHVLYKNKAVAIKNILYFKLHNGSLEFSQNQISKKSIFLMQSDLYINDQDKDQEEKVRLNLGQIITVGSESFQLIKVT